MKEFRKIVKIIIVSVMIPVILISCNQNIISTSSKAGFRRPVKVGVVLHTFDPYMSLIRQNLEEIQKENSGNVEFTFLDSKDNEAIQSENIDRLLQDNVDLLLLNLVNVKENTVEAAISNIKQKNIPVILFFSLEPARMNAVKAYEKVFVVSSDFQQSGTLEGNILVDLWNSNKAAIDKNGDNIIQYIMLQGPRNNEQSEARTKYSILAINNAGIKTEELASQVCNWDREVAKNSIEVLFLRYDGEIEAIIANNDAMAIGAIEALQKYGYNKGDKTKNIAVVGIDAIPEARDLIRKGFMTVTIFQDPYAQAQTLYLIGMNLFYGRSPIEGTDYKLDKDEKVIYTPYQQYTGE